MRTPYTITLLAEVGEDKVARLKDYLRDNIDPPSKTGNKCDDSDLVYSALPDLHFCSFFVLDTDTSHDSPPLLVFEATMDSEPKEFLENLVGSSPEAIDRIFEHCEGYPGNAKKFSRGVVEYLLLRAVSDGAHYCGYPGRTVGQIKSEGELRSLIRAHIDSFVGGKALLPATFADVHRKIKGLLRADERFRWAENPIAPPFQVRQKKLIIGIAAIVLAGLAIAVFQLFNSFFTPDITGLNHLSAKVAQCFLSLPAVPNEYASVADCGFSSQFFLENFGNLPNLFLVLVGGWFFLRLGKHIASAFELARSTFWNTMAGSFLAVLAIVSFVFVLIAGFKLMLPIFHLDGVVKESPGFWLLLVTFVGSILMLLFLSMFDAKTVKSVELGRATHDGSVLRLAGADMFTLVRALTWIFYIIAALLFVVFVLDWLGMHSSRGGAYSFLIPKFQEFFSINGHWLVTWAARLSVLLISLISVIFILLAVIRVYEFIGSLFHTDASALTKQFRNHAQKTAREEHGINTHQNHLVSMVYVKSWIARWILRAVLWGVNKVAIYLHNEGELGQIPTIFSARWTIIDGGKRMIFMTHYGGAFDSYINEFLDLAGVRGVNAIWTNTMSRDPLDVEADKRNGAKPTRYIRFPLTKFLFWGGAEKERQFKEYIRASQVETLAWYSAYPNMVVTNINNNTFIRNSLFKQLSIPELEELAGRI